MAFVGQSGSGKSTIIKLIERFYGISAGKIFFGSSDAEGIKIKSLQKQIGLVNQEATIFSGTVEENITYGLQDYDKEEVYNVAEKSGCMEFLSN